MTIKKSCLVKNNSFQISWTILISKCVEKSIFYPEYFHCNIAEYFHWNIAKYCLWNISILNISTDMFLSFRIEFRNISTDVWNFVDIITQNQNYKTLCCRIFHRNIEENRKHVNLAQEWQGWKHVLYNYIIWPQMSKAIVQCDCCVS